MLQFHVEIESDEQDSTQTTNARSTANTMPGGREPITAQDNRASVGQDDGGIARNRDPAAIGLLEFQAGGAIPEDDREGSVVRVGAASIE